MKFVDSIRVKNKYGFSLFEVVVTMAIIAIFIAAASNVFTQKFKKKVALPAHGRFECYYNNAGQLTQRLISENVVVQDFHPTGEAVLEDGEEVDPDNPPEPVPLDYCTFEPVKAASYLVINAVGGGGAGGRYSSSYGGSSGSYRSVFLTTTTHKLRVYPGRGAVYNGTDSSPKGGTTYITDEDSDNREVLRLAGGRSNSGGDLLYKSCEFVYSLYRCRRDPYCELDEVNKQARIGYCSANSDSTSAESTTTISYSTLRSQYTYNTNADLSNGVITYAYKTSNGQSGILAGNVVIFNLALEVEGNFTKVEQPSGFSTYLDALEVEDGVAAVSPRPGVGGGIQTSGGTGAVVIAW